MASLIAQPLSAAPHFGVVPVTQLKSRSSQVRIVSDVPRANLREKVMPHELIRQSGYEFKLYVMLFTAEWCGPCRAFKPTVDMLESEGIKVFRFDVDRYPDVAKRMGIRSVPTLIVMNDSKVQQQFIGAQPLSKLLNFLKKFNDADNGRPRPRPRPRPEPRPKPDEDIDWDFTF